MKAKLKYITVLRTYRCSSDARFWFLSLWDNPADPRPSLFGKSGSTMKCRRSLWPSR